MSKFDLTKAFAITLAIGCASAAFAQETTAPAEGAAPTEAAPAATPETAPAAAEAAPAADGPGTVYVKATNGDWEERCMRGGEGQPDLCQMYQELKDQTGNNVALISMFPLPAGEKAVAGAVVSVPLLTLLPAGLSMQIDSSKAKSYPYTFCDQASCVARIGFLPEEVAAMKKGNKITMQLVPAQAPDQVVKVEVSLKGFTSAYDAMPPATKP